MTDSATIDDRPIEQIAIRVATALRDELADIAAPTIGRDPEQALTVDDVAKRLGVARSTVYTHWREWGGYKLGPSDKAAIRFRPTGLPEPSATLRQPTPRTEPRPGSPHRGRRHRSVLSGTPRLPTEFDNARADPVNPVEDTPTTPQLMLR